VTTQPAASAIVDVGYIDPVFHQGKAPVMYYVLQSMIPWGIAMVSYRKIAHVSTLFVFKVETEGYFFQRTNHRGIFCSPVAVPPIDLQTSMVWLQNCDRNMGPRKEVKNG
jgi:hypothetical protein